MPQEKTQAEFRPLGAWGVEVAEAGDHLLVRIPKTRAAAHPVKEGGKIAMTANSGGWQQIGSDGFRVSVMAGFKG